MHIKELRWKITITIEPIGDVGSQTYTHTLNLHRSTRKCFFAHSFQRTDTAPMEVNIHCRVCDVIAMSRDNVTYV